MQRSRIYHVLIVFFLCATCYGAGWTPELWNPTNTWAYDASKPAYTNADGVFTQAVDTSATLAVNVLETNLYAVCVTDIITQVSTTNYIPEITTNFANYLEFRSWNTNNVILTNEYYLNIKPYSTNITLVTTNDTFGTTNSLFTNLYEFVDGDITNTISTTVSRSETDSITSFKLDVDDQRELEIYNSIKERYELYTSEDSYNIKFYKDSHSNIEEMKNNILEILSDSKVVDISKFTNDSYETYFAYYLSTNGENRTSFPIMEKTNFYEYSWFPTNYLSYTPWKANDYGRYVTSSIIITPSYIYPDPEQIYYQWLYLYNGSKVLVSGTNGQVVSAVYTNNNIDQNFKSSDYATLNIMTSVISKIIHYIPDSLPYAEMANSSRYTADGDNVLVSVAQSTAYTNYGVIREATTTNNTYTLRRYASAFAPLGLTIKEGATKTNSDTNSVNYGLNEYYLGVFFSSKLAVLDYWMKPILQTRTNEISTIYTNAYKEHFYCAPSSISEYLYPWMTNVYNGYYLAEDYSYELHELYVPDASYICSTGSAVGSSDFDIKPGVNWFYSDTSETGGTRLVGYDLKGISFINFAVTNGFKYY